MAIYVDDLTEYPYKKGKWCHMASNQSLEELHEMAQKIGLQRCWFQDHATCPHYDLQPAIRKLAIRNGAIAVSGVELVKKCSILFNNLRSHFPKTKSEATPKDPKPNAS